MKSKKLFPGMASIAVTAFLFIGSNSLAQENWVAPVSADEIVNPLKGDANAAASGKKTYKMLCAVCHGAKGKGDGIGSAGLQPKPTDLTSTKVQAQTDGAIFWKIEEGRSPMPSYKTTLQEKKRWEIINYIRKLKK